MKILLRNVLAAVAGLVVGIALMMAVQLAGSKLYPLPPGLEPSSDSDAFRQHVNNLPIAAILIVLASYFAGVFGGGWVASRFSATCHWRQGIIVGVFFFAASLADLLSFHHPVWFWITNLAIVPVAGWLGLYFGEPEERPLD